MKVYYSQSKVLKEHVDLVILSTVKEFLPSLFEVRELFVEIKNRILTTFTMYLK